MSKFDELITKACELVVAEEAENFDKDAKEARRARHHARGARCHAGPELELDGERKK